MTVWPTSAVTGPSAWMRSMATRASAPRASGTVGVPKREPAWARQQGVWAGEWQAKVARVEAQAGVAPALRL